MPEPETLTLFVNAAAADQPETDLEKLLGETDGVRAVEVGPPDPQTGAGPVAVHRLALTYDPDVTTPEALRARLETLGYIVTALPDLGE